MEVSIPDPSVMVQNMDSARMIQGIALHSEAMAVDGARNLDAAVAACPGWTVRDLVEHIGRVQWFWSELVERRVQDQAEMNDVSYPSDRGEPLDWFRTQTARLVAGLQTMADTDSLWTWWEPEQTALFAKRRQFNEVVVHGYDARHAVGDPRPVPSDAAIVGLDEFVAIMAKDLSDDQPTPPPLALVATDVNWTSVLFEGNPGPTLALEGSASDLLLSLWSRLPVRDPAVGAALSAIDLS
jgi:uncharacterized protein (TIGR03083 family)